MNLQVSTDTRRFFLSLLIAAHLWFYGGLSGGALPEDPVFEGYMKEAGERLRGKDYAGAAPILQAALAREPYSVVAHDALGVVYSQLAQYTLAIQEFKAALQINPKLALTHNNLGYVYLQLRRWDEAEREFQQALQIEPDNATAHANLGRVYAATGRRAETAPPSPGYKIIVTDPTQILHEGKSAPYYRIDPTQSCLVEVAPGPAQTLRLHVWLAQPDVKTYLYWSFVPAQPGPQRTPLTAAVPPVSQTVSGLRLTSAGAVDLVLPAGTRQCFLSASQPVYVQLVRPEIRS